MFRYHLMEGILEEERALYLQQRLVPLIETYKSKSSEWIKENSQLAPNYNLFNILRVNKFEAIAHTPFLANLLNPKETHCQGVLFYNTFLKTVLKDSNLSYFLIQNIHEIECESEKCVGEFGVIDILIKGKSKSNPFAIIIENKIYALDQFLQLERYYNYLVNTLKYKRKHILIFYLNVKSKRPSELSINKKLRDKLIKEKVLIPISYVEQINEWLDMVGQHIKAPRVADMIKQYKQVINHL